MAAEDDQLKRMIDRTDNPVLCTHLQDIPKNPSDHALLPLKRRVRDLLGNNVLEESRCAPCIQHARRNPSVSEDFNRARDTKRSSTAIN